MTMVKSKIIIYLYVQGWNITFIFKYWKFWNIG